MNEHYIVFGAPDIREPEILEVVDSLRSGWIGTGPKVAKFENLFRSYIGAQYAVALGSCTAGLHLSLLAANVGPGDEVITTPMTFVATVNSIVHTGATPVMVDCDRATQLIDPQRIEDAITFRTKAIIPVHLCGRPCDMDSVMEIASKYGLVVIDDAAHAIEAKYKGRKVGTIGDLTCFSFYVTKNATTAEGGIVTTANPDYAQRIKTLGLHGMSKDAWKRFSDDGYKHYEVVCPGFKYNMTDIQAAIGLHQLERIEESLARRNEIWRAYMDAFAGLPVYLPAADEDDTVHARHLFTLMIDPTRSGMDRDEFMRLLHLAGIGTGVHYVGVHLHDYYRRTFSLQRDDFPNATWISERTVSLPLSTKLLDEQVLRIIETVKHLFH